MLTIVMMLNNVSIPSHFLWRRSWSQL